MSGRHTAIIDGNSPRRIVYCAQGHRCTVPDNALSDGVAASHSCPICGLGVPKEKTGNQHHGTCRVHPQEMRDHAALIRKMDRIANAAGPVQTTERTARLLDCAAALADSHAVLLKALTNISEQMTSAELLEDAGEDLSPDYETGYDTIIEIAREAIAKAEAA